MVISQNSKGYYVKTGSADGSSSGLVFNVPNGCYFKGTLSASGYPSSGTFMLVSLTRNGTECFRDSAKTATASMFNGFSMEIELPPGSWVWSIQNASSNATTFCVGRIIEESAQITSL